MNIIPEPSELLQPDPRRLAFKFFDSALGGHRSMDIYDVHRFLKSLNLRADLPDDVARHLGISCRCAMFSVFEYELVIPMFLHAAAAAERSLRRHYDDSRTPFKHLLKKAIDEGLISKASLHNTKHRHENVHPINWDDIEQNILRILPEFRNSFAHAKNTLIDLMDLLPVCFDIVNACSLGATAAVEPEAAAGE